LPARFTIRAKKISSTMMNASIRMVVPRSSSLISRMASIFRGMFRRHQRPKMTSM